MHLAEFETAVRYRLPLLVVVFNDEALGAEYHRYMGKGIDLDATRISTPDLGTVGRALGGRGALMRSPNELRAAAREFLSSLGPTLVDLKMCPATSSASTTAASSTARKRNAALAMMPRRSPDRVTRERPST
jgi:thiamine pyrophosphate-dependent acetolactate synthase large subunit-like protein